MIVIDYYHRFLVLFINSTINFMPVLISISGGSGSGKTTLARRIAERHGPAVIMDQDGYYRDLGHLSGLDVGHHNFDHPDAVDMDMLARHIKQLKSASPIDKPVYDFATHSRKATHKIESASLIVLEGLFVLWEERLRDLADIKIFVDEADDIRFIRRLMRDITERGCTVQSVVDLYLNYVKPMYAEYVLPSREFADYIISGSPNDSDEWEKLSAAVTAKLVSCQQEKDGALS